MKDTYYVLAKVVWCGECDDFAIEEIIRFKYNVAFASKEIYHYINAHYIHDDWDKSVKEYREGNRLYYYVDDINDKSSRTMYHIILIAMTENARKEINKIMSTANTDGYYYKPRIDLNMLLSLTSTDTVVTTACVAGRMFIDGWEEYLLHPVYNHFKNNFFLEVQAHVADKQKEYNKKILDAHKK